MMIAHNIDYRATGNAPVAIKKWEETRWVTESLWLLGVPVSVLLIWYVVTHIL